MLIVSATLACLAQQTSPNPATENRGTSNAYLEGFIPLGPPTLEELKKQAVATESKQAAKRRERTKPTAADNSASDLLVQMLQSTDAEIRARAVEGLAGDAAKDAAPLLLIALADRDGQVRDAAERALTNVPKDVLVSSLVGVLGWGDPVVAKSVDAALPRLRDTIEAPLIVRFESRETPRVERMAAAYCLGRIGSQRAGVPLAGEIWGDDLTLAFYCADALSSVENPNLLGEFVRMAAHPQVQMRVAAYRGLARIGGDDARKTLIEAASGRAERDTAARKIAIRLLAYVPNEEVQSEPSQ